LAWLPFIQILNDEGKFVGLIIIVGDVVHCIENVFSDSRSDNSRGTTILGDRYLQ
jgi:hypothetical protein